MECHCDSTWTRQTFQPTQSLSSHHVTGPWNRTSSYVSWTGVSSGTGQRYLSDSITVQLINGCARDWWTWRLYLCCLISTASWYYFLWSFQSLMHVAWWWHDTMSMFVWYFMYLRDLSFTQKWQVESPVNTSGFFYSTRSRAPLKH
jgi:hypothetical protein